MGKKWKIGKFYISIGGPFIKGSDIGFVFGFGIGWQKLRICRPFLSIRILWWLLEIGLN